jgi:radical SAM family protein/4Fe-4S single cluster protein
MHLAEALALRARPAAGLFLSLTRRCPLHCDHCSTRSTMRSEQLDAEPYLRLVSTFTPDDRPDIVSLTGGEPLLRPRLVGQIARIAQSSGAKVEILTGAYFAALAERPRAIGRALGGLDHVAVSIDRFHEREVPRPAVLAFLQRLIDQGTDVSVQLTGDSPGDPYLDEAVDEIRATLRDHCPIYVAVVAPFGRAAEWLPSRQENGDVTAEPCRVASWPVVAFDGTVVACCNQDAVDGPAPEHLRLGHAAVDDWPTIRRRAQESYMLRAIRSFGPGWLAEHDGGGACAGYCETCAGLTDHPGLTDRVRTRMGRPEIGLIERAAMRTIPSPQQWTRIPRFGHLVNLGLPEPQPVPA